MPQGYSIATAMETASIPFRPDTRGANREQSLRKSSEYLTGPHHSVQVRGVKVQDTGREQKEAPCDEQPGRPQSQFVYLPPSARDLGQSGRSSRPLAIGRLVATFVSRNLRGLSAWKSRGQQHRRAVSTCSLEVTLQAPVRAKNARCIRDSRRCRPLSRENLRSHQFFGAG